MRLRFINRRKTEGMSLMMSRCAVFLIGMVLMVSWIVPGCAQKQSEAQKPGTSSEQDQKPEAPPALEDMRADMAAIISELETKVKRQKMSSLQQKTELVSEEELQQGGTQQKSGQEQQGDWQKEESSLKKIHLKWNILEPEAMRAGLNPTSRNNFEKALNELTEAIGQHKLEESIFAAINLYKYYSDVAEVFETPVPPALFRVKYETMKAAAEAGRGNWQTAQQHSVKIQEEWEGLKTKAQEVEKNLTNRTEFSIFDFKQAVESQQLVLVMIKSEIVMRNLQELEKKF
ncbi:MAG: hypothetical protein H5T98_03570 [Syntrophomonadaceae bacterium]|nr:hypothetical protein [Syntrophomonadaceae bacterium]